MANLFFHSTEANSWASTLGGLPDAGVSAGSVNIYTGSSPGTGTAASGTLLAEMTLNDPSFSVTDNVATIQTGTAVEDTSANASGTAGYARFFDSDSAVCFDVTVGATGSGAGLELDSTSITSGQTVTVTGGDITFPTGP